MGTCQALSHWIYRPQLVLGCTGVKELEAMALLLHDAQTLLLIEDFAPLE